MVTEISSLSDLDDMRNNLSEDYVLTSEIFASDTQNWNNGNGFEPIGTYSDPFTGSLDCQGYGIYDLYSSGSRAGIFGYTENCIIKNCFFSGLELESGGSAGISCRSKGCTFENIQIYGDIFSNGAGKAGFLVGYVPESADSIIINNCSIDGFIGNFSNSGGMIGETETDTYISNSDVFIEISGSECGGMIGYCDIYDSSNNVEIKNCDVTGTIGPVSIMSGGIAGRLYGDGSTLIENCTVDVTFTEINNYCGGISGYYGNALVKDCDIDFTVQNANDTVFGVGYIYHVKNTDINMDVNTNAGGAMGISYYTGISGDTTHPYIENCNIDMTLRGSPRYVHGFSAYKGSIRDCSVNFDMKDACTSMHMFGWYPGDIKGMKRCYATGNIKATSFIAPIEGDLNNLKDCYYNCYIEGVVGENSETGPDFHAIANEYHFNIENFYIVPNLTGSFNLIDFTNFNDSPDSEYPPEKSIYYNEKVFGRTNDQYTGLTTDQMTGEVAEENMEEFDFRTVWHTTDSYPVFERQIEDYRVKSDQVFVNGNPVILKI